MKQHVILFSILGVACGGPLDEPEQDEATAHVLQARHSCHTYFRGQPQFRGGTLVTDRRRPLRGVRHSIDLFGRVETLIQDLSIARDYGVNALHIYAEQWQAGSAGANLEAVRRAVCFARRENMYVIITIGGRPNVTPPVPGAPGWSQALRFGRDFWNIYAAEFAGDPNVVFELFNEPEYPGTTALAGNRMAELEAELYTVVRAHAPSTPVLLFSYAKFHRAQDVEVDVQNVNAFLTARRRPPIDWRRTGIAFHGYANVTRTAATIDALPYPVIETEQAVGGHAGVTALDIPAIQAYEARGVSWLSFLEVSSAEATEHRVGYTTFKRPLRNAGITWSYGTGSAYP